MDRQQELQFLGFFGIFKESFKIISSWRKIFGQITLALVIPLSALSLPHTVISDLLISNVTNDIVNGLVDTQGSTDVTASKVATFLLFEAAYFIFLVILYLPATAAVVYTIACIYTAKEITFKKVMRAVPRVWKRLVVTFLWSCAVAFVYNFVAGVLIFLLRHFFLGGSVVGFILIMILAIACSIGIVYIFIVWVLANVVSVLEKVYVIKSMMKSRALIKGKMGVAVAFLILLSFCFAGIEVVFEVFVVNDKFSLGIRIVVGILCCLFLFMVVLFGLVVQTVIYFVCKSYHHESIDSFSLTAHL